MFPIYINNNTIRDVECLKMLGIHFTNKYYWKQHYISLKKSLVQRVNLTIYQHTSILVKSLILSKIDYGLLLVGNTTKSNINIINGLYRWAILSVFMLFALQYTCRIRSNQSKILAKLSFSNNSIVGNDVKKQMSAKRTFRYSSAIYESLKLSETITYIHNYVWIIVLVSHTTYVVCVNFIHTWRDLQFKVDSSRQIFWETFIAWNLQRGNCRRNTFCILFWCLAWGANRGFSSNKLTHYLLDHGGSYWNT